MNELIPLIVEQISIILELMYIFGVLSVFFWYFRPGINPNADVYYGYTLSEIGAIIFMAIVWPCVLIVMAIIMFYGFFKHTDTPDWME